MYHCFWCFFFFLFYFFFLGEGEGGGGGGGWTTNLVEALFRVNSNNFSLKKKIRDFPIFIY